MIEWLGVGGNVGVRKVVVEVLLCARPSFACGHHERVLKRVDGSMGYFRGQMGMDDSHRRWSGKVR